MCNKVKVEVAKGKKWASFILKRKEFLVGCRPGRFPENNLK